MKRLLLILAFCGLLTSCETINTITIVDQQVYYNENAVFAYIFYQELYENNVIKTKPIIIGRNDSIFHKAVIMP